MFGSILFSRSKSSRGNEKTRLFFSRSSHQSVGQLKRRRKRTRCENFSFLGTTTFIAQEKENRRETRDEREREHFSDKLILKQSFLFSVWKRAFAVNLQAMSMIIGSILLFLFIHLEFTNGQNQITGKFKEESRLNWFRCLCEKVHRVQQLFDDQISSSSSHEWPFMISRMFVH